MGERKPMGERKRVANVARKTLAVSARELSRRMSRILDDIQSEGTARIVIRYGRPSAALIPFDEMQGAPRLPRYVDVLKGSLETVDDFDEASLDGLELTDSARSILLDIRDCTDLCWTPSRMTATMNVTEIAVAFSELELGGLGERDGWAWSLTRKGEALTARLHSSHESDVSDHR
jgi:antitoxin (DNA-binding transcriptional repressor) of toxin-antitoxin stability system